MHQIDLDLISLFETWYEVVVVIPGDILHEDGVMLRLWLYQPIAIPETIVVDDEAVRQAIDIGC